MKSYFWNFNTADLSLKTNHSTIRLTCNTF